MAGLNKLPKGSKCAAKYRSGPKKGKCKRFSTPKRKRSTARRRKKTTRRKSRCKVVSIRGQGRRRLCWGKNGKIKSNTKVRGKSRKRSSRKRRR